MVLVTGGTGFVGRSIVRRLLSRGERVRVLYRSERRRFIPDEKSNGSPERSARGRVCSAGEGGRCGHPSRRHSGRAGRKDIRETACRWNAKCGGGDEPGRGAPPSPHERPRNRSNAASRYHRTKWQAEELVRAAPLDATIFRPSLIFGREDRSINLLAKIASYSPVVPVVGPGENRFQPVWVEDVAEAFVQSLHNPNAYGKRYELCGPRVYTFNDLIGLILRIKEISRPKVHLPIWALKGPAALAERIFPAPAHPRSTDDASGRQRLQ